MNIDWKIIGEEYGSKLANSPLFLDFEEALDHGVLVSNVASRLARELGYDEEFIKEIAIAGFLHDIGKLKLGSYLEGNTSKNLKVEEMKYVRLHPEFSYEILKNLGYNDNILSSVLHHHENYDGSGYPDNLKGDNIPQGARILRVCDVFVALASERAYRSAFSINSAMELMIDEVKNFDMKMYLALQRVVFGGSFGDIEFLIYDANNEVRKNKEVREDDDNAET